jgi:hypothetical protein
MPVRLTRRLCGVCRDIYTAISELVSRLASAHHENYSESSLDLGILIEFSGVIVLRIVAGAMGIMIAHCRYWVWHSLRNEADRSRVPG